jgi:hypothetical protein
LTPSVLDPKEPMIMAKMTICLFKGRSISVDEALSRRDDARKRGDADPYFECDECNKPVRPHRSGGHAQVHFEHLELNGDCSQSHVRRM